MTVYFIGAGPGDPELITVKAQRLINQCPVILYAGSLVPREIFADVEKKAEAIIDTASISLHEIIEHIEKAHQQGKDVARVHSGDPSLYGAIGEQIRRLETLGIDFNQLIKAIKKYKPKVIQLVHVYGCPAKYTFQIRNLCKKKKIYLMEDFSESLGAKINNKKVGTFGDINISSIRSEKMIGVGEGGVVVCNNTKLFKKIKTLASRNSPFRRKFDPYWKKYYCLGEGYNYLLPHLLGAVARAQIEKFEKSILKKKISLGKNYEKIFKTNEMKITQKVPKNFKSVYWLNSVYFKKKSINGVREIGKFLEKNGIEVRSGFWPLNKLNNFNSKYVGSEKVSEMIFNKILVLPSNLNIKYKDVLYFKKIVEKKL